MAEVTRRGFIKQASVSAVAVGALTAVPGLSAVHAASEAHGVDLAATEFTGPLVAHVRNVASGEVAVLVGTREIVIHDRALVRRLVKAAR